MRAIKSLLLGAALLLCGGISAKANPPCCLFIISAGPEMAAVTLNGVSLIHNAQTFKEGDVLWASYGGCPPGTVVAAYITGLKWDNTAKRYVVVSTKAIELGGSCESGDWTLHAECHLAPLGCQFDEMSYTQGQQYCPCGN